MKDEKPRNTYKGKKIDARLFMENFDLYSKGQINQMTFSENVGLSRPTLRKHLYSLLSDGYIDGIFFTDGNKVSISFGEPSNKVIYPVL